MSEIIQAIDPQPVPVEELPPARKPVEIMAEVVAAKSDLEQARTTVQQATGARRDNLTELMKQSFQAGQTPSDSPAVDQCNVMLRVSVDAAGNVTILNLTVWLDPEA